ncbi:LacI family transcriptional regulator [Thermolongibacillus altinsuensis]|uniref:LacI family transcriptional regulator n=1 Tax=Thermolongibacillus altinsuensis TaxID=575256 RepID=A0A4R1QKF9_9BACL|nr:LacI family DNA-binding transcriptional regulator [Thermolongibacillus altinsuensis]TCL45813.1 LacI family transcriptional regulator [Thermolongibacillus altinsuensis]GMB09739.1 LacI family transcriptional regulator [Thermolongibacillus altinsuensis]
MNYTIVDIALRAGVSKSTVSRVISGKGFASKEAREKVLKAIEELQYKPNGLARAMVSQRTNNIGVIIYHQHPSITTHPFYGKILDAILKKAKSLNYSVFVETDEETSLKSADFMLEKRVDGLILISKLNQEVVSYIDKFNVPYVIVNGAIEKDDVIHIVNHDRKGGSVVADHLYQLGHRRIFVISGPQDHRIHSLRFEGFSQRIRELGGEITIRDTYFSTTSTFDDGYKGLSDIWDHFLARKPTALFATSDMLAMGAMKFLLEKGLKIPNDIAVVGFDDTDYSKMFHPSLTTVHVDQVKMGEDAVFLLDQLIKKENVQPLKIEYEPKLVIRESTNGS